MRLLSLAFILLQSLPEAASAAPAAVPPPVQRPRPSFFGATYKDKGTDVDARVEDLLKRMTLDEKIDLLSGVNGMDLKANPRLGIPSLHMTDGPLGVRAESGDRATAFPAGILSAATFDPALMKQAAAAMAEETLALGRDMLLGPCVNIARAPQGGRNFESFGEDPYLAARMAEAWIAGLQGKKVLASVKHFALNNQEFRRMTVDVRADERAIHEIYLPAFEAAVKAGAWTVMTAYNRINGQFGSENSYLLQEILKKRWGFRGFVESDWDGTHSTVEAANNGLDVEMPGGVFFTDKLRQAVRDQKVSETVVDDKARRVLRAMIGGGVFDRAESDRPARATVGGAAHRALALKLAQEGIVVLKNDALLPLKNAKSIAVIGPDAAQDASGGGSSSVPSFDAVSPFEGLRRGLGLNASLRYAAGVEFPVVVPFEEGVLMPPAGKGTGPGLLGEYFANPNLEGTPALARVDRTIDFVYDQKSPDPKIPRENFSARWTGRLRSKVTGDFDLAVRCDDGARLWIDGKLLVDQWFGQPPTTYAARVHLEAGRDHEVKLEYYQGALGAMVQLGWLRVAAPRYDVAVEAARGADAVVVLVGTSGDLEGENVDRFSLELPNGQEELISRVAAVNKNVIVVLQGGSPFLGGRWIGKARAVVSAWFPGEAGGQALSDILLGRVNPSGKTPVTWPKRWEDSSAFGRFPGDGMSVDYSEGLYVGYRWFDKRQVEPLFPFGHGLSYTTFAYSNLAATPEGVSFDVTNSGARAGAEVAQLYVASRGSPVDRPAQELKGFARVELEPGQTKRVTLALDKRAFSFYDASIHEWTAAPGRYVARVGASSRDVRLEKELDFK